MSYCNILIFKLNNIAQRIYVTSENTRHKNDNICQEKHIIESKIYFRRKTVS